MTFKEFKKRLKDIFLSPPPKISWEFPKVAFEDLKRIFIEVLGNNRGELGVPKDKLEVLAETILPDIVAFFETEEGKALLATLGIEGEYEGIGHCVIGYADGDEPAAKPRKEGWVYYVR